VPRMLQKFALLARPLGPTLACDRFAQPAGPADGTAGRRSEPPETGHRRGRYGRHSATMASKGGLRVIDPALARRCRGAPNWLSARLLEWIQNRLICAEESRPALAQSDERACSRSWGWMLAGRGSPDCAGQLHRRTAGNERWRTICPDAAGSSGHVSTSGWACRPSLTGRGVASPPRRRVLRVRAVVDGCCTRTAI